MAIGPYGPVVATLTRYRADSSGSLTPKAPLRGWTADFDCEGSIRTEGRNLILTGAAEPFRIGTSVRMSYRSAEAEAEIGVRRPMPKALRSIPEIRGRAPKLPRNGLSALRCI